MKKEYDAPYAEKIGFNYAEQVVASNNGPIDGPAECNAVQAFSFRYLGCINTPIGTGVMNT